DRRLGIEGPEAIEGEAHPLPIALSPMKRSPPPLRRCHREAVGEPELGALVAAVLHEGEVFAVGDEAGGELERLQEDAMGRALVVVGEIASAGADLERAFRIRMPPQAWGALAPERVLDRAVGGLERVEREEVEDVRQQKLLMLLLVLE